MKFFEKICLKGCAYTVLLMTLFYFFAIFSNMAEQFMPAGRFFVILLFGFIISFAEGLYQWLKMGRIFRCLIHYFILLCAFFVVFIVSGNLIIKGAGTIFAAIIIFTALYFLVWLIVHFTGMGISKLDGKKSADTKKSEVKNPQYKPRYKD